MNQVNIWLYAGNDEFSNTLISKIQSIENFKVGLKTDNLEQLQNEIKISDPDILLFDLEITGYKSGIKTIGDILEASESIRIVVLINQENEKIIYSSICKGAYDYFDKSQPVTNVEVKMIEILKSNTPLTGLLNNKIKKSFETAGKTSNNFNLTEREQQIVNLLIGGLTKRKIAEILVLSYHTIDSHLRNIYRKLGVQSRSQAITKLLNGNLAMTE